MPKADTLLVEVLVEELPPALLESVCSQFAGSLHRRLAERGFVNADKPPRTCVTLRRLACLFDEAKGSSAESRKTVRGPAVEAALDADGKPTKALEGFARSANVDVDSLERVTHKGREHFAAVRTTAAEPLESVLAAMVEAALGDVVAPRIMRWGDGEHRFVRPVRGIVLLRGDRAVAGNVMGIVAGQVTRGHRALAPGEIRIDRADQYEKTLENEGHVVADFGRRKKIIRDALRERGKEKGLAYLPPDGDADASPALRANEELVAENAAMVENVGVHFADIDRPGLPPELLAACAQGQQKYLMAADPSGKPAEYAIVSGNPTDESEEGVLRGNRMVLDARLDDAEFFFGRDRDLPQEVLKERLKATVHHHRLSQASQADRTLRIGGIGDALASKLGANRETVARAADLVLRDLATATVGEFPELQGRVILHLLPDAMRRGDVGRALGQCLARVYTPPHLRLPDDGKMSSEASCLALAYYSELLVGLAAVGELPTGSRDPFGLRRCALGIVRMAVGERLPFRLGALLAVAADSHGEPAAGNEGLVGECADFVLARARNYPGLFEVDGVFRGWLANAVLGADDDVLCWLQEKAAALAKFAADPAAPSLVEANKRIGNIFRKSGEEAADAGPVDPSLFASTQEKSLYDAFSASADGVEQLREQGDFLGVLAKLATLAAPLDAFFEEVMVNDPDPGLRRNRFRLLGRVRALLNSVADFSAIELADRDGQG